MYSKGKYSTAQREAEHAGRGMWAGSYVEPWLFRACVRQGGRPGDCSDDANSILKSKAPDCSRAFALGGNHPPLERMSTFAAAFRSSHVIGAGTSVVLIR
jgi:hypothetical protein